MVLRCLPRGSIIRQRVSLRCRAALGVNGLTCWRVRAFVIGVDQPSPSSSSSCDSSIRHNRWTSRAGCLCQRTKNQGIVVHIQHTVQVLIALAGTAAVEPPAPLEVPGHWSRVLARRHRRCPIERRNSRFGPPLNQRWCRQVS